MTECSECGQQFDVDDARDDYDSEPEFNGELSYDEDFPEHSLCGDCAIRRSQEDLHAGAQYQFSLDTGLPPEDMPGDYDPGF